MFICNKLWAALEISSTWSLDLTLELHIPLKLTLQFPCMRYSSLHWGNIAHILIESRNNMKFFLSFYFKFTNIQLSAECIYKKDCKIAAYVAIIQSHVIVPIPACPLPQPPASSSPFPVPIFLSPNPLPPPGFMRHSEALRPTRQSEAQHNLYLTSTLIWRMPSEQGRG